jgi:hypothetical protein
MALSAACHTKHQVKRQSKAEQHTNMRELDFCILSLLQCSSSITTNSVNRQT